MPLMCCSVYLERAQPVPAPRKDTLVSPKLACSGSTSPHNLSLGNDLTLQTAFISFGLNFPPPPRSRIATSLMLFVLVFWMTEP